MKEITIAYIGGGSMNFGWRLISELAGEENLGGTVRLYDIDKQLSLANEVIGNKMMENPNNKSKFIYLATDTAEEALRNADFVILSINQSTPEEEMADIHIPETYGIYQTSGENAGPASVMRAVRTLPFYIKIAELIKQCCPNAWVINLTNPMNVCLKILYDTFPEIKAFGSSNEGFAAQELLAEMVSKNNGGIKVSRREIKTNIIGINHFTWINEVSYQGNDLIPEFRRFAEEYSESGFEKKPNEYKTNPNANANMIKFDLFMRYGFIPSSDDKSMAEFCPPWYLRNPKVASAWKIALPAPSQMKRMKTEKAMRSKRLMTGEEALKVGSSGTDCVLQIKALLGLNNLISNADCLNKGQISNLPYGEVVQTKVLFSQNSIQPVISGDLPDEICSLTLRHIFNQKMLVRAVKEKDLDIAFNAFINDPLSSIDLVSATEAYRELLKISRTHLMYYI